MTGFEPRIPEVVRDYRFTNCPTTTDKVIVLEEFIFRLSPLLQRYSGCLLQIEVIGGSIYLTLTSKVTFVSMLKLCYLYCNDHTANGIYV